MSTPAGAGDFAARLAARAEEVDAALARLLPRTDANDGGGRLAEAMRYAALGPGKRMRPFLVLETAHLFAVDPARAVRAAAAIECVHAYSLVHDDLPAMDDDDMRRGRATVHRAFDEATAILAGDGLLTLAFEIVCDPRTHEDAHVRAELALKIAQAAGWAGMVGGQMLDLTAERGAADETQVTRLQRMKTGALIAVACEAGGLLGKAGPQAMKALAGYAHDLGLAFQIADDLLDVTGEADKVGKATGKDADAGKTTFVDILGVEGAKARARLLVDQAVEHLAHFDGRAESLRAAARFTVEREH
ncbi:polyprenyl synthetase family protein [Futiania mangrovi]|uniref:Polyprenyl synthetase family protein n=1 Tax=Futiania mangrovi TaxID=2959716 RepID=A0A9J6PFF1_9PROT|nr:farnesyl diphosphate synthase [Futiania mangrovii]MCP1337449.1 polyprenyl synthetase family protein [Futiania mangrovii]